MFLDFESPVTKNLFMTGFMSWFMSLVLIFLFSLGRVEIVIVPGNKKIISLISRF